MKVDHGFVEIQNGGDMYLVIIKVRDILFYKKNLILNNAKLIPVHTMDTKWLWKMINLKYIYYICFNLISI